MKYQTSQNVYSRNWRATAQRHYESRIYHWLSEQLIPYAPERVLDIGCGSGHGLAALREVLGKDLLIVAIDENRSCLDVASDILREHGEEAKVIHRMTVSQGPEGFDHVATALSFDANASCTLIESDLCNDEYLAAALRDSGSFDAVTVWLTGVHMLRQFNVNVRAHGIDSDGAHRLYVQNCSYELADAVLRSGGVLQVGDRGQTPDTQLLEADMLQAHAHQASVTSLQVKTLSYRPYEEPAQRRTPMVLTPGLAGLAPSAFQPAIISILSEKP